MAAKTFTDCLYPDLLQQLVDNLKGVRYEATQLAATIELNVAQVSNHAEEFSEIADWLRTTLK